MSVILQPSSTMNEIQKALATESEVTFTPGNYYITKMLYLERPIKINAIGALWRQANKINHLLMSRVNKNTVGYCGVNNITINGLTLEAMAKYKTNLNLITLWHIQNAVLNGVTFKDAYHFHALELNGCKNVIVNESNFFGYNADLKKDFREQIQIDYSSESAIFFLPSGSRCYDNTCCQDIVIRGCKFDKSKSRPAASACIGNHGQADGGRQHKRITIENNVFCGYGTNNKESCIKLIGMEDVVIRGNEAEGFGRFVYAYARNESYNKRGIKVAAGTEDGLVERVNYYDNNVTNPSWNYKAYKYYLDNGRK